MAREEQAFQPPPRKPTLEFQTPSPAVAFFSEPINRDDPSFYENAPIKRGTLYSTIKGAKQEIIDAYPLLYFVKESRLGTSDQWVIWTWSTESDAESTYNATVEYVSESTAAPKFTRVYDIRRDVYDASTPTALGTPLKSVIAVKVTAGGTGYLSTDTVVFGSPGSGAVANLVVDSSGVIKSVVITNEGAGYTSAPSVTITTATGSGATLTAVIQPQSAVLVSQKKQEFPDDHPLRNEFVQVILVYETLPGPFVASTRIDEDGKVVTINKRLNVAANITSAETLVGGVWTKTTKNGQDSYVAEEVVETRDIPGNIITESKLDDAGNVITVFRQMVATADVVTSESVNVGHVWLKKYGTPISDLVSWQIQEQLQLPGNVEPSTKLDEDGVPVYVFKRLQEVALITPNETLIGGIWTKTYYEQVSDLVAMEVREQRAIPGNPVESDRVDDDGIKVAVVRTMESAATIAAITPRETLSGGIWTKITSEAISDLVAWKIVETRAIPGNPIPYTRIDDDSKIVSGQRTLKESSVIVSQETLIGGTWTHRFSEKVGDLVSWEIVESRDIPGNGITSTKVEEDGKILTINKTLKGATTITSDESIIANVWSKTHREDVSDLVAFEVVESRPLPGNSIPETKLDEDGVKISIQRTLKDTSTITTAETVIAGVWTKTTKKEATALSTEQVADLVSWEVIETRTLPGNPVPSTKLDQAGNEIDVVKTLKEASTITPSEIIDGSNVWIKTYSEAVTDLVAWEIVEVLQLPGNIVPSAKIGSDHEIANIAKRLKDESAITPSASEVGGIITTVEQNEVSDLVSEEVTTVKEFLDEASYSIAIPNLIPEWARPQLATVIESHILSGTASQPTLGPREFQATEKQLTKLLYERRVEKIPDSVTFPVTAVNTQTTEQYGGAVLQEIVTLDDNPMTAEEGSNIVSSETTTLAVGSLYMRVTKGNPDFAWPILDSTHVDEKYGLVIPIQKQVVAAGATGGVSGGVYTEVRALDKWRSLTIASHLDTSSLPEDTQWFSGQRHSFPPELIDAVINWAVANCSCSSSFSSILQANMKQYTGFVKTRITEQFYDGPPPDDVVIDQFFPESHNFGYAWWSACGDSDGNCRTKTGAPLFHIPLCLHDDITLSVGAIIWNFPATTPAALPHGNYIMLSPHIERWRFGVFRRLLIEVLVP